MSKCVTVTQAILLRQKNVHVLFELSRSISFEFFLKCTRLAILTHLPIDIFVCHTKLQNLSFQNYHLESKLFCE